MKDLKVRVEDGIKGRLKSIARKQIRSVNEQVIFYILAGLERDECLPQEPAGD